MIRYIVASLCGISLAGSVYMGGWGTECMTRHGGSMADECEACAAGSPVALADIAATGPASKAGVDMKNTKCIVMGDDVGNSTLSVTADGKLYHICCSDCIAEFNKEPAKFVKAFNADPTKFGVKK